MQKKSMIHGKIFGFFLTLIIVGAMLLFAVHYLDKIKISLCQNELILFEQDLKDSVEKMYSKFDSVQEKRLMVPCDIDRIYFIDLDKDMEASFKSLYEFPFIEDSINADVRENAFFIKDGKLVGSSHIGNIELKEPYFVCSDTSGGTLNLYMSGKGASAEISNTDCGNDCTFEVVELDEEIVKQIIEHAKQLPAGGPEGDIETELRIFRETNKKVKIARRFNCGRKPGETVVEILIKGNARNFKLIESIPKECVDELYDYLSNMTGDYDSVKILSDPLIVWHFNSISEETIVSYILNSSMTENCLDSFESIGLAVTPESENLTQEEIDNPEDDVLVCVNGETMPCPKQDGVCSGSTQTCANNNWPGCSDTDYLSYNSNYEAVETRCDNLDNDCDGNVDEGLMSAFYKDSDNDGYGNPLDSIETCALPSGYVANSQDCDDSNAGIKPGADEVCDSIDNNCDGSIDEGGLCDCNLNSAYWNTGSAVEGELVTLTVEGSDGCNGKAVSFEVREDDGGRILYDSVVINPNPAIFSGISAAATWTAEYQNDGIGNPEYYFIATVPDDGGISSSDPDLKVVEGCVPSCASVCGGEDDGCGGICSLNNNLGCDDSNACTYNDICAGGSCSGTAITCNDNKVCTDDSCSSGTGCVYTPNTAACNDNDACTHNDVCSGGTCSGTGYTCEGGVCDNTAVCDGLGGCARTYSSAGTFCDTCKECDGNGNCVNVPDGTICGTNEVCENGGCETIVTDFSILTCEKRWDSEDRCTHDFDINKLCDRGGSLSNDECDCKKGWFGVEYDCGLEYVCYEYETVETECLENPVCPSGYSQKARRSCIPAVAELSASYSNLHHDSGSNRWYYNLVITENNGVGVTLSYRIRCFQSIGCQAPKYDPVAKFGTNRINPNGQITANNRWFLTIHHPDKITETWYGTDDKGNSVEAGYSIDTP